jgi:hypothetical protein
VRGVTTNHYGTLVVWQRGPNLCHYGQQLGDRHADAYPCVRKLASDLVCTRQRSRVNMDRNWACPASRF